MSVNQKVLDAIELLTKNSVQKASYDKTIQAQIISCEDATIGKYKCRYQDSTFYAYASNAEVSYSNKAMVYVLVPGNDMSRDKTILGTTKKLGINYITQAEGDEAYDKIGKNCIKDEALKKKFYLDTNYDQYVYTIYSDDNAEGNDILNLEDAEQYITKSSSLLVGATFKTNIDITKQLRGHYGIIYNLQFKDNATGDSIIKSYAVEVNNMSDNPYRLVAPTRQYKLFDIDGVNFEKVKSIQIFCKDFPESTIHNPNNIKLNAGDIEITALQLYGTARMTQQEINGVAISFYTPKGTFFTSATDEDNEKNTKIITAQVRIKGKLVSTTSQKLEFYWGKQNLSVTNRSQYYNKKLGRGWKCLNEFNIISSVDDGYTEPIVEWVPGSDTIYCKPSEATARDNRFKVAVVYDGNVITKEINIQNLNNKPNIIIESDSGVKFYYDVGHPTLTCKVFGADGNEIDVNSVTAIGEQIKPNYIFTWGIENTDGMLELLEVTLEEKRDYDIISTLVQKTQADIDNHHKPIANAALLNKLLNGDGEGADSNKYIIRESDHVILKEKFGSDYSIPEKVLGYNYYKSVQIIDHNKIYNFQIRSITGFATIKCAVQEYSKEDGYVYKGTGSIKLINSLQPDSTYSLGIENGKVSFKYNENGVAPTSNSVDHPQEIFALKAQLFDENGNEIDERILQTCPITWKFPLENTLLDIDTFNLEATGNYQEKDGYGYYSNSLTFLYDIKKTYNIRRQDNQIELIIDYKDFHLTTKTDFVFLKEGQPGSNGTEYVIKIVPKVGTVLPLEKGVNGYFDVQVWKNGELYWTSANANAREENKPTLVMWEFLTNSLSQTSSSFNVEKNSNDLSVRVSWNDQEDFDISAPKNDILKCTVTYNSESEHGSYPEATKNYYGTLPISSVFHSNTSYKVSLKEGTGFNYVIYSSDGQSPQYDNTFPFEIIVQKESADIDNDDLYEDVSLDEDEKILYDFNTIGSSQNLKIRTSNNLNKNQCVCIPVDRYGGDCVDNNLICIIRKIDEAGNTSSNLAQIRIPIHFMLNRYELAHLNDWDGNSIKIDDNEGYILAPQMGAGKKEQDNSFTGVLMGEVKKLNYSNVGLFGYNKGQRSFFLNSKNGSTILGSKENSQIIMDPSASRALIYSSNFWKDYNEQTGLPNFNPTGPFYANYRKDNFEAKADDTDKATGQGLLIDLTTPQIYAGHGHFYLTNTDGRIAGWAFSNHTLFSVSGDKGSSEYTGIVMTVSPRPDDPSKPNIGDIKGRIFLGKHNNFKSTEPGFCLSERGLSIGSKVRISADGIAEFGNLSGRHWTINGGGSITIEEGNTTYSSISYGNKGSSGSVYIGTDSISLGSNFSVDNEGSLISKSGEIGSWTISGTSLSSGNIVINGYNGSIYHYNKTTDTSNWGIQSDGSAYFTSVTTLEGAGSFSWGIPNWQTSIDSFGSLSSPSGDFNTGGYSNSLYVPDGYGNGGTWDLSYNGIYTLVVDQINARAITADEITAGIVWIYEGDVKRSVEGAIHNIESDILDLQIAVASLQLGG